MVALLKLGGAVKHAVVLHARVSGQHAVGGGSAHRQARPSAVPESRHESGFGGAETDALDKPEGRYLNGTHDLRRFRAAKLREVAPLLLFRKLVRSATP